MALDDDRARYEAAAYLAGIIDGEGCVGLYRGQRTGRPLGQIRVERRVMIANTDVSILTAVRECLDLLGIGYRMRWREPTGTQKKRWAMIDITRRKDLLRLHREVRLRSEDKAAKFEEILLSYEESSYGAQKRAREEVV